MDMQKITVLVLVVIALAFFVRRIYLAIHGKSDCGCGKGTSCPSKNCQQTAKPWHSLTASGKHCVTPK